MDDAELVGGVLLDAPDPRAVVTILTGLLTNASSDSRASKIAPELVAALRSHFAGATPERIAQACAEGAAWAAGRASAPLTASWELVATVPSPLPSGLRRTTAETLVHLVTNAQIRVRLASPFIDEVGLGYLTDAVVAATGRTVTVDIFLPTRSTHAATAIRYLVAAVGAEGNPQRLSLKPQPPDSPWAHLKVLTADGSRAYIGSANLTGPGLSGASNFELGVMVRGNEVAAIDRLLDHFAMES